MGNYCVSVTQWHTWVTHTGSYLTERVVGARGGDSTAPCPAHVLVELMPISPCCVPVSVMGAHRGPGRPAGQSCCHDGTGQEAAAGRAGQRADHRLGMPGIEN